jgi:hypothetical protein
MITDAQKNKLRTAFKKNELRIRSVSPEGTVVWKRVLQVFRNEVPWERIVSITTPYGSIPFTGGHKLYTTPTVKKKAEDFRPGDHVVAVVDDKILYVPVTEIKELPPRQFMYDLTADTWANFSCCGVLVKNSPDRNYHFRPPEFEGDIGKYDRIFGQVWEDAELLEYIERALDWFNMFPPLTQRINTVDLLCTEMPAWRTAILWGAISHACFALAANWVVDEFSLKGDTTVTVFLPGEKSVRMTMAGVFDACHVPFPASRHPMHQEIRDAFREGTLMVASVDPETGRVEKRQVSDVLRHLTPHKRMVKVFLEGNRSVTVTEDHSLFKMDGKRIVPVRTADLVSGDILSVVAEGENQASGAKITSFLDEPREEFTYDLSVPGFENFVLSNGIVAHNSYSIGGVSLDIEKSSKYESLKQNAESMFDKSTEAKKSTVLFIRGLQQPRFGLGVRSAFGPAVGKGVLSPRAFL